MSETDWVVQRDDNKYQVPDVATLQEWARAGNVRADDQIWSPLRGDWSIAIETPEVADLLVRPSLPVVAPPIVPVTFDAGMQRTRASVAARAGAYLIDVIPATLVSLIALIPLVGHILAGLLLGFYWLYRDAAKFSLGKIALGLDVVQVNGEPASKHALVRRNLPFAIAGFVTSFPVLGMVLGPLTAVAVFVTTVILLLTTGYSLGDKWAGTTVVTRV